MLLKNDKEKQVILEQNPLTKRLSISIIYKNTRNKTTYTDIDIVRDLFCKYTEERR